MGINEIIQIGNRIRKLRSEKGLTQKEMSELTGIPYSTYSNYENNNREPSLEQLEKIAGVLDIHLAELMGLTYKENVMDIDDVFKFYDSLGYIVKPIDENSYRLISRDITNHIKLTITWEELQKIKDDTWKYLRFVLNDRFNKPPEE